MPPPRRIAGPLVEYLGLAVLVGGAFMLVALGVGDWAGVPRAHPALLLASVLLVGVGFEPARSRWRQLANRLVYGHRRSPWETSPRIP